MSNNDNWLALGCALLAIILALVGILLPEQISMSTYPYANLTGVPNTFPYGNLTGVPNVNLMHGLNLWLSFDGIALDKSGFRYDGNVFGSSYVSGRFNKALSFDGVNDYVSITDSNSLDFTTDNFTIIFWYCRNENPSGGGTFRFICVKSDDYWNDNYYGIYVLKTNQDKFYFGVRQSGVDYINNYDASFNIGDFHFIVFLRLGTMGYLYIDNVQVASVVIPLSLTVTADNLVIMGNSGLDRCVNGSIDELRIYNRNLSLMEINTLYNLPF